MRFIPKPDTLPASQRALWSELGTTPDIFTLYGGTALALRESELVQVAPQTLTCRVDRGGPVLISFFGGLELGRVEAPDQDSETGLRIASLRDIAGTKAAVIQKRAEVKDYIDIDALLQAGIDLPAILEAGRVVYGKRFNPLITLKALSYFDDVAALPDAVRDRLAKAVRALDITGAGL